jgi:hypothetical protein
MSTDISDGAKERDVYRACSVMPGSSPGMTKQLDPGTTEQSYLAMTDVGRAGARDHT